MIDERRKKIPPHDLATEEHLISSIMMNNAILKEVSLIVEAKDFYQPDLKIIFEGILNVSRRGDIVDIITLSNELAPALENIGGFKRLSDVVMRSETSVNAIKYAKLVKEKSFQRAAIMYAREIAEAAYIGVDELLQAMHNAPSFNLNKNKHKLTSELIQINLNDIRDRMMAKDDSRGMTTGFIDLDRLTDGIKGAEIIGFYAESNAGKSIIASDIARHVAKKYGEVAVFAYEMLGEDITYRMLADEMKIPIQSFNKPKNNIKGPEVEKIKGYDAKRLDNIHIFADELTQKTAHEVDCHVSIIKDCKLIIIDYLHLMKSMEKTNNDIDKYTLILRELKSVAIKNRIPMIILMSETAEGKFRGTQELKHDFDQMWKLVRNGDDEQKHIREYAKIVVNKGRNNGKGKVELWYDEAYLTFRNKEK